MDLTPAAFAALSSDDVARQEAVLPRVLDALQAYAKLSVFEHAEAASSGVAWTEVWERLTALLSTLENPKLRKSIVRALGKSWSLVAYNPLLGERALDTLMQIRQDPAVGVRMSVTSVLGKTGDRAVVDALMALAEDEHPQVRLTAYAALGKFALPKAIPVLYKAYMERASDDEENDQVAETVLGALRKFGIKADAIERYDLSLRQESLAAQLETFQQESTGDWHNVLRSLLNERNILAIGEAIGYAGERAHLLRRDLKKAMLALDSSDERMAILRTFLSQPASPQMWRSLIEFLLTWPDEPALEMAVMYADQHLAHWPSASRVFVEQYSVSNLSSIMGTPVWPLVRALELVSFYSRAVDDLVEGDQLALIERLRIELSSSYTSLDRAWWERLFRRLQEGPLQELVLSFRDGQIDEHSWAALHRVCKGELPFSLALHFGGFLPEHFEDIGKLALIKPVGRVVFSRCSLSLYLAGQLAKMKCLTGPLRRWSSPRRSWRRFLKGRFFSRPLRCHSMMGRQVMKPWMCSLPGRLVRRWKRSPWRALGSLMMGCRRCLPGQDWRSSTP